MTTENKKVLKSKINNGFYYDIDFGEESINDEDLKKIEKKLKNFKNKM